MRLIFYIFLFSQLFNFFDVLAEKIKKEPSDKYIKWEKIDKKKSKNFKKIIWKSYKDNDGYFENKLFGTDEIELDGDKYVVQCSKNDYTNGKKEITCVFDKSTWKTRKLLWGAKFTKRDATDIEFVKYGYKVRAKYNTDKGCPKDKKWHVTIVRDTP
mgnify:CR=1 FL=1